MTPILGLSIIAVAAVCLILIERRFPYESRQHFLRSGFTLDFVWYTLVQSYLLGLVISQLIHWLDRNVSWSHGSWIGEWPLWAQVLFFFLTHDLYIYAFHRAQHRFPVLWRVHEAHHSPRDVDWLSGSRSHPFEIFINQTIEFTPIVLLGAAPEVAAIKGVLDAVWGMYIHSNINVHSGAWQRVFNGPEMHRWHHAPELAIPGKNFATKLALWDWIFGTAALPPTKPWNYGLVAEDDAQFPQDDARKGSGLRSVLFVSFRTYLKQVLHAFRTWENVEGSAGASDVNRIS